MSSGVRWCAATVWTAATVAIRLALRFSPLEMRFSSLCLRVSAALRVAGRRSSLRITTPLPSAVTTRSSLAAPPDQCRALALRAEIVEVHGSPRRELLGLPLRNARPRRFSNVGHGLVKRCLGHHQRGSPLHGMRVQLRREVQLRVQREERLHAWQPVAHPRDLHLAEDALEPTPRHELVRPPHTIGPHHRRADVAQSTQVDVPLQELPKDLHALALDERLDLAVGHRARLCSPQALGQRPQRPLRTIERVFNDDDLCSAHGWAFRCDVGVLQLVTCHREALSTSLFSC